MFFLKFGLRLVHRVYFQNTCKKISSGGKCRPKAATGGVLWKSFLKILQNSKKNTGPLKGHTYLNKPPKQVFFCEFCEEFLRMCLYRVHSGDCFWMCLLFFDFRFVLLLYSFVKLSVSVNFWIFSNVKKFILQKMLPKS